MNFPDSAADFMGGSLFEQKSHRTRLNGTGDISEFSGRMETVCQRWGNTLNRGDGLGDFILIVLLLWRGDDSGQRLCD